MLTSVSPSDTRLLSKDEPARTDKAERIPSASKATAILLGSPGEMPVEERIVAKSSRGGSKGGLQGVLRDLLLARAFLSKNSYSIFECMHGMRLFRLA